MIQKANIGQLVHLYEILDEVHATSSPSYLLPNYTPNQSSVLEIKYKCNGNWRSNYNQRILFTKNASWNTPGCIGISYENGRPGYLTVKFNTSSSYEITNARIAWDNTTPHIVKYDMNNLYYDGDIVATRTMTYGTPSDELLLSTVNISNSSTDQGYYSFYYFNIYESGDLIHEFVPVRRISDNAIGFYDKQNDNFIAWQGGVAYTSKQIPEYIDEYHAGALYVNDIKHNNNSINRIYLNGEVYWGGIIPSQTSIYEILNEIHPVQNSGSVYFNTNYLYKSNTTIETQYECMSDVLSTISGIWPRLYQSDTTPHYGAQVVAASHEPTLHIKRNGYSNWNIYSNYGWASGLRTLRQSQSEVSINGTVLWSGTQPYTNTTYPIILMNDGGHDQGTTGMFYIYYYKFYESSTLVHEYLPVKRLSDNEYGFYDSVTDTFLTNLGTGSVTGTSKSTPEYIYG